MLAFLIVASLVGVLGSAVVHTNQTVLLEVERLQSRALAATDAAARMTQALHFSQETAHAMVAARYRTLASPTDWPVGEADHEWEPDPATEALVGELDAGIRSLGVEIENVRELGLFPAQPAESDASSAGDESGEVTGTMFDNLETDMEQYRSLVTRFIHLARYHPTTDVNDFLTNQLEVYYRGTLLPAVTGYSGYAQEGLEEELNLLRSVFATAGRRNFLLTVVAFVTAVSLSLIIARTISRPLDELQSAFRRLGAGQLDTRVVLRTRTEIGTLADAFNQMASALEATTISRSYLDNVIQSMNEMLFVADAEGRVETVNQAALEALGYAREQIIGGPVSILFADAEPEDTVLANGDPSIDGTRRLTKSNGEKVLVSVSSAGLHGLPPGATLYLAQDITEQKAAERRLKASIEEKDVLLKEIHHRVKNNLQVISSLLSLQSAETSSADVRRAFRNSQSRIRSMALIHEHLYRSADLAHIRFGPYIERLVDIVRRTYADEPSRHRVEIEVDDTSLPVDAAIAYGMTINELLSNALEHAFPDGSAGSISIRFATDENSHRLSLSDDGAGFAAGIDPRTAETLGLRLVREFVSQLKGTVEFDTTAGTTVRLTAPRQLRDATDIASGRASQGAA